MQTPRLKITFLGTGNSSGVPMIGCSCKVCVSTNKKDNRLRSSILVQSATTSFVIDTTPDFRYQMLRANVQQLDAVLFTHPHKDHIAGLDDAHRVPSIIAVGKPMELYANSLTEEAIKREFAYAFSDKKYPGIPNLNINTIDNNPFYIGDIFIQPILVWHIKMPVLGFRMGDFTYITDANKIEADELKKIIGSKVLVLNALRKEKHISHFNLNEAVALAQQLQIPKTYFTHLSHQMGLHAEVSAELPEGIFLGWDGLEIEM